MKKNLILGLLVVVFVFTMIASLRAEEEMGNVPYWWRGRNFVGKITAVDKDKVFVLDEKNSVKKRFEINSQTRIFLRDTEKMEIGMTIRIVYKETKQLNIAKAIREVKE